MTLKKAFILVLFSFQKILPGFCGFHDANLNNLENLMYLVDESLSSNKKKKLWEKKGQWILGKG